MSQSNLFINKNRSFRVTWFAFSIFACFVAGIYMLFSPERRGDGIMIVLMSIFLGLPMVVGIHIGRNQSGVLFEDGVLKNVIIKKGVMMPRRASSGGAGVLRLEDIARVRLSKFRVSAMMSAFLEVTDKDGLRGVIIYLGHYDNEAELLQIIATAAVQNGAFIHKDAKKILKV